MFAELLKKINIQSVFPYMMIVLVVAYFQIGLNTQKDSMVQFMNAVQDSTAHRVDKWGRSFSETSQIRSSDSKIFLNLKTDDPAVKQLQDEVKKLNSKLKDGSSVTNFTEDTHIDVITSNGVFRDNWVSVNNTNQDRSIVDIKNKYSVSLIEDKGEYLVNVRNDNPYSKGVDSVKTFVKTSKPEKKWSLGVGASYDPIEGTIKPSIGLHYKIINLF